MDPDDKQAQVQDAEIVNEAEVVELDPKQDEANLIMNLESMIKSHLDQIEKARVELSKNKEMLAAAFEQDPTYLEHAAAAKEANKVKAKTKAEILKKPDLAELAAKVKSMSSELKETQAALSDYLREFNRVSGLTEIEAADGELLEIVYVARVKRKRQ